MRKKIVLQFNVSLNLNSFSSHLLKATYKDSVDQFDILLNF